jgi:N6-adenosine-specific RNA methylase IME4
VTARQAEARRLINNGMSQRQAAKVLRVGLGTVQRDLTRDGSQSDPKRVTKAERRALREGELAARQNALPRKRYGVILADPEWRFEPYNRDTGMDRAADNHYPTSITDDIVRRDVAGIAADDCVLFLWATVPMLADALRVMDAWGFTYKSHAIWAKVHIGTGYWFRNRHELLLVGIKGDVPAPAMGDQFASVMTIARKEHSAKPEQFLELIEQYFPHLPKIELNRRGALRPGWDAWGNEAFGNDHA